MYWFSSQPVSWRDVLETLLTASGLALLSSHVEMNGNSISCLPILPLPAFVKTPANTSRSCGSPTTGSDFPSEHARRIAIVPLTCQQSGGLKAQMISTEVRSSQESLSITEEVSAWPEVLAREKATPLVALPPVLLLSAAIQTVTCSVRPSHEQ